MKLPFLRIFDNSRSNISLLTCNGCFGLFTKIIKRSGTGFCCTFSAWFFHKNVIYLILSMDKVSMSYFFSFSRYQTKCVIEFLFRQLMMSWTLRFIFNHPLMQWSTGRKRRKDRNTKNWIYWEWKELFRWNKKQFSQFLKDYHSVKN